MPESRHPTSRTILRLGLSLALLALLVPAARAVDLVALSPETWDRYAPQGKEVDCIFGDFVLCNDQILAVVANPVRGRNANMTVREVGGSIIDLTRRDRPSDQLGAYYPGGLLNGLRFAGVEVRGASVYQTSDPGRMFVRARSITLKCFAQPKDGQADVAVAYTVEDGSPFVRVETTFTNPGRSPIDVELVDAIRADRSFAKAPDGKSELFWVYDKWFGQAYGLLAEDHEIVSGSSPTLSTLRLSFRGKTRITLAPSQSHRLTRRLIPGANLLDVKAVAARLAGREVRRVALGVVAPGKSELPPSVVPDADVALTSGGQAYAAGRTDGSGALEFDLPEGEYRATVAAPGQGSKTVTIPAEASARLEVSLAPAGWVSARITDGRGDPIPCKVQFIGEEGTADPDFGPTTGEHAVRNLYYSHDGRFVRAVPPGKYEAIVSHGPEFDAVTARLDVRPGETAPLEAKLVRSVETPGWVSADFHSHSSPSGDNTSSQLGRVLNLLCEQVEFAPCTEHNRVSTYTPHLARLGVEHLMATCCGIELTGKPLPINHQNAFPLVMQAGRQDGGGPTPDDDPEVQIERLALWDQASEKLVQVNHPDIGHMFFDRDGDGRPDVGYRGMVGHMDVIEVHPLHTIFDGPTVARQGLVYNNTIVNWLQLLNRSHRIPGVVNTDAHENFHGSGWLRNYLKSPTDDPARIQASDIVRAAEKGRVIVTNGPFLEVGLRAEQGPEGEATAGDDVAAPSGRATLRVRVQCPNWFDVDRVQVFLNGRPPESLNFTRAASPGRFADGVVKFAGEIPLELKEDTHVIVAAIGERSRLGRIMGPQHAKDRPVAVSNPIFVDVDGGGFKANGDALGVPLPVKGGRPAR